MPEVLRSVVDEENFDPELRVMASDGATPYEVFSQATAWLGARDGAVGVFAVSWHCADGDPYGMTIYYQPGPGRPPAKP